MSIEYQFLFFFQIPGNNFNQLIDDLLTDFYSIGDTLEGTKTPSVSFLRLIISMRELCNN